MAVLRSGSGGGNKLGGGKGGRHKVRHSEENREWDGRQIRGWRRSSPGQDNELVVLPRVWEFIKLCCPFLIVSAGRDVTIICCISVTGVYLPPFLIFAKKRILPELVGKAKGRCNNNARREKHHHGWVAALHITSSPPFDVSFFRPLKTYYSQACDNFMVTHPGQTITDKNIGELLSAAYFKAATVRNAVKRFKECGIEPHNPLVFSEHDFAAAKTTDHNVVSDATEINSASPQTLAVENQHINPPKEPELVAKADSDAPKKPVIVFYFKQLPKAGVSNTRPAST
ncbi:DDE-1 domain-containing protein [Trichonephila clavipes]|nr:DDE-1 domain-containing protein [Trichonephila clavipes]